MSIKSLIPTLLAFGGLAHAANFTLQDDGKGITFLEAGKPALTYNYGFIDPPEDRKDRVAEVGLRLRLGFIHPIYGLDGDVLTENYPHDHLHHRGVFWAWPHSTIGGKLFDLWLLKDCHTVFVKWLEKPAGGALGRLSAENSWVFDATPGVQVKEQVDLTVHPADVTGRAIDLRLIFTNVSGQVVTIQGTLDESNGVMKGYGGLTLRYDGLRQPTQITIASGDAPEDIFRAKTGWADLTSPQGENGPLSGIAVFQHPKNPQYPYEGWILRHYGVIGASWPCVEPHILQPNESVTLQYRLYVHKGSAQEGKVVEAFEAFLKQAQ